MKLITDTFLTKLFILYSSIRRHQSDVFSSCLLKLLRTNSRSIISNVSSVYNHCHKQYILKFISWFLLSLDKYFLFVQVFATCKREKDSLLERATFCELITRSLWSDIRHSGSFRFLYFWQVKNVCLKSNYMITHSKSERKS